MGNEGIGDGKHSHLVYRFINLDMIRQMVKVFPVSPHGDNDLPICLLQSTNAVPVEVPVLVDCSHGNIDRLLRPFLIGLRNWPNLRPYKMIAVRECMGAGLEIL